MRVPDALKDFSWENFHFHFSSSHSFFYTSCRRRPPTLTTPPTPTPLHSHGHPCYVIRRTRNLGSKEAFLILDFVNVSLLLLSPKTLSEDFTRLNLVAPIFFFLLLPLIMPHNERYPTLNSHRRYRHTNRTWFCCEAVRLFVGEFNYAVTFFRFLRFLLFSFLRFFYSTCTTVLGYWL